MDKFIMLLAFLIILSGCGSNQLSDEGNGKDHYVKVKNTEAENMDRDEGQAAAGHLEKLASSVPEVNGATAVVFGKYAIVGIDIDAAVERSEAGSIKYSVAEALKDDPNGARAVVIADPDINARLRDISSDIKGGQPAQLILYQLADITGRLMPEVPGRLVQPTPSKSTEEPKKQLPSEEKKKLEQKQEQESHYRK